MARHDRLPRLSRMWAAICRQGGGALICHESLHELRSEHAAQLPVAGPDCQYYLPIGNLLGIARRAWDPATARGRAAGPASDHGVSRAPGA